MKIIITPMTHAQAAYEEDRRRKPTYHDGQQRPSWDKLGDHAKRSWERIEYPHPVCREVDELACVIKNSLAWGVIVGFFAILYSL